MPNKLTHISDENSKSSQINIVIEHDPVRPTTANHQSVEQSHNPSVKTFGKRRKTSPGASVSHDFFSKSTEPGSKPFPGQNRFSLSDNTSFLTSLMASGLPIKSIAAVFCIALIVPMVFIATTERLRTTGIDPITTASLNPSSYIAGGLTVDDVSMTKIMKSDSNVVTVFGRLENKSGTNKAMKPLWVTLYDKQGNIVQSWQHKIRKATIGKGQKFRFMTSAIDYSGNARTVSVTTEPQN